MKVLDLQCGHQHSFEGWFASEDDFTGQLERGLVSCPLCGDDRIEKKLSAPRLNLRTSRSEPAPAAAPVDVVEADPRSSLQALQAHMVATLRRLVAESEDVGERFADQARAMHHGEVERRNIRGRTTPQEALELLEEGVDVLPLAPLAGAQGNLAVTPPAGGGATGVIRGRGRAGRGRAGCACRPR